MTYEWHFTPDAADITACNGASLGCQSGDSWPKESTAIWHGRKWMKEVGRTGTITAIPHEPASTASYILDI